ncbi:MAG: TetR family transcriptional regulator C-terminal domain-containing protein, partial [Pseudomonadota bacterium]
RHMAQQYQAHWTAALGRAASDPAARLAAMVDADFDPQIASRKGVTVWYAFWGEAKSRPAYLAACAEKDREYLEALDACVAAVAATGSYRLDPVAVARTFDAVTDGFWLDRLTDPQCPPVDEFIAATDLMLSTYFPRHYPSGAAA